MYAGQVMEEAPSERLFHAPAHPYTVGLLRSVPRLDRGKTARLIPIEGLPPDTSRPIPGCPFAPRCRWAQERCHEEFPPAVEFEPGHRAYCWRAEEVYRADLGTHASQAHIDEVEARIQAGESIPEHTKGDEDE